MNNNAYRNNRSFTRMAKSGADSIERGATRAFDSLVGSHPIIRLRLLLATKLGGASMISPTPAEIIQSIVAKAREGLVTWGCNGAGTQCPDCYEVAVSVAAWRAYYGSNTDGICRRIEREVRERLQRKYGCSVEPRVSIQPTNSLLDGECTVEASYYDARYDQNAEVDEAATDWPGSQDGSERTVRIDPAGHACAYAGVGRDASEDAEAATGDVERNEGSEVSEVPEAPEAPEAATAAAPEFTPAPVLDSSIVVAYGRKRYPVTREMTIGVVRGDTPDQADIRLPYSQDFYLVSRKHGRFTYDEPAQAWRFEQLGSNGSTLVRDGEVSAVLKKGDSVLLKDGDGLLLAGARQQVSILEPTEDRTVCQYQS